MVARYAVIMGRLTRVAVPTVVGIFKVTNQRYKQTLQAMAPMALLWH